jgi:hypothetical protein
LKDKVKKMLAKARRKATCSRQSQTKKLFNSRKDNLWRKRDKEKELKLRS